MAGPTWDAIIQAAATGVTGIAAVIAAVFVARGQGRIITRQVRLQELEVRNQVFERRMDAYNKIRNYIAAILITGEWQRPDAAHQDAMAEAQSNILYLFSSDIIEYLRQVDELMMANLVWKRVVDQSDGPSPLLDNVVEDLEAGFSELYFVYETMPYVFMSHLHLGEVD